MSGRFADLAGEHTFHAFAVFCNLAATLGLKVDLARVFASGRDSDHTGLSAVQSDIHQQFSSARILLDFLFECNVNVSENSRSDKQFGHSFASNHITLTHVSAEAADISAACHE